MNWTCDLTADAEKDLRELPLSIRERLTQVLDQLGASPFQGDVKPLKGREWRGVFRRRMGHIEYSSQLITRLERCWFSEFSFDQRRRIDSRINAHCAEPPWLPS